MPQMIIPDPNTLATSSSPGAMGAAQTTDLLCSGDITTAQAAAITSVSAGGGTVRHSSGTGIVTAQINIPAAGSPLKMKTLRLLGQGPGHTGDVQQSLPWTAPNGGTVLDMRYAGGSKLISQGSGYLEMADLSLIDTVDGTQTFCEFGFTTPNIHNVEFYGKTIASEVVKPTQDAIKLWNGGFLGFGAKIENCYFNGIQRGLYGKIYTNGVIFRGNTFAVGCGGHAAVTIDGASGFNVGSVIEDNLIEMLEYVYGVELLNGSTGNVLRNSFFDPGTPSLSCYYFDATSIGNIVIVDHYEGVLATGPGAPFQTYVNAGATSVYYKGASVAPVPVTAGAGAITAGLTYYVDSGTVKTALAKADAVATARGIVGVARDSFTANASGLLYSEQIQRITADVSCVPVIGGKAYLSGATAGNVTSVLTGIMYPRLLGYFTEAAVGGDGMVGVRLALDDARDDATEWAIYDATVSGSAASAVTTNVTRALWSKLALVCSKWMDAGAAINVAVPSASGTGLMWFNNAMTGVLPGLVTDTNIGLVSGGASGSVARVIETWISGGDWEGVVDTAAYGTATTRDRSSTMYPATSAPNTIGLSAARAIFVVGARTVVTGKVRTA